MPDAFFQADSALPDLRRYEGTDAKLEAVQNYLFLLLENLRYLLRNLSPENFNQSEMTDWIGKTVKAETVISNTVITNELYSNFKGVTVDGYALTNGNQYYVSSKDGEHILVALNPAYLKLLSSANYHTIQIYSTVNGPATGYFRNYGVSQTIYGVKTGDDNNIALWVTLCVLGFAGAAGIVLAKRKDIFGK